MSTRCSAWVVLALAGAGLSQLQCSHVLSVFAGGLLLSYLSSVICCLICIAGFRGGDCRLVLVKCCMSSCVTVTAPFKCRVVLLLTPLDAVTCGGPGGVAW